jgi:hypothetical protein
LTHLGGQFLILRRQNDHFFEIGQIPFQFLGILDPLLLDSEFLEYGLCLVLIRPEILGQSFLLESFDFCPALAEVKETPSAD